MVNTVAHTGLVDAHAYSVTGVTEVIICQLRRRVKIKNIILYVLYIDLDLFGMIWRHFL